MDVKKIITKQFFNTLSPDVCHHLMVLAKERIDETEGEYVKAIDEYICRSSGYYYRTLDWSALGDYEEDNVYSLFDDSTGEFLVDTE